MQCIPQPAFYISFLSLESTILSISASENILPICHSILRWLQINTRSFGGIALNITLLLSRVLIIPIVSFGQRIIGAIIKSLVLDGSRQLISARQLVSLLSPISNKKKLKLTPSQSPLLPQRPGPSHSSKYLWGW